MWGREFGIQMTRLSHYAHVCCFVVKENCIRLPLLGKNKISHVSRLFLRLNSGHVIPVFLGFSEDFLETL